MLHVTCAIIEQNEKILICQRSESMKLPLKWEFPGGKLEDGESLETCLAREIQEELGIMIQIVKQLSPVVHHYVSFTITLHPFTAIILSGEIELKEHLQYRWVTLKEVNNFDLAEADLPILKEL